MKVCYVDESGHCGEKFDRSQPVEVLCGVITDLSKLFKTQNEHNQIMDMLANNGLNLAELKAVEIYKGHEEWNKIKPQTRDAIYTALLKWSIERKCSFIICPIDCKTFFGIKDSGDPLAKRLEFPWEAGALNVTMAIQRHFVGKKNNKGRTFVIFDEQKNHDSRFLKLFEQDMSFTDEFTKNTPPKRSKKPLRFNQIVDVPHFSKSHLSVLIQLADLAAYVVNRQLLLTVYGASEKYEGEAQKITNWYKYLGKKLIEPTSIDARGRSSIAIFYKNLRPQGWSAQKMKEEAMSQ